MAKLLNIPAYDKSKEEFLGVVASGHTVLLKDPSGGQPVPYIVCKIGNTGLNKQEDLQHTVTLCNIITGRLVLKKYGIKVVVVSNEVNLTEYNGGITHVKR